MVLDLVAFAVEGLGRMWGVHPGSVPRGCIEGGALRKHSPDMLNPRFVCILLECILVLIIMQFMPFTVSHKHRKYSSVMFRVADQRRIQDSP